MRLLLIVAICVLLASSISASCLKPRPFHEKKFRVHSPQPHTYLHADQIPTDFDWRNKDGVNYCTGSRNQHIPQYCGACFAMAPTSALADRVRIARHAAFPDFMMSVQSILHCVPSGCGGGDTDDVHEFIANNGVPVDTCVNFVAVGDGFHCTPENRCLNCDPSNCSAVKKFPIFGIDEYGSLNGVDQMKSEIYARGPISCQLYAPPLLKWGLGPNRTSIFDQGVGLTNADHEIGVVGFGQDNGVDYWIIRNSWGEYWGDVGYFKLKMGDNQLGIESNTCSWATPIIPNNLLS